VSYLTLNNPPTDAAHGANKAYVDSAMQSQVTNWGGTAGGTTNALTVALTPAPTALAAGLRVRFIAAYQNTTSATLALNTFTAATIVRPDGTALGWADLRAGWAYDVEYDGAHWRLLSMPPSQMATGFGSAQTLASAERAHEGKARAHHPCTKFHLLAYGNPPNTITIRFFSERKTGDTIQWLEQEQK